MLKEASKAPASRATEPPPSRGACLGIGTHLHRAALGPGHGAAQQQQVLPGDDLDHGQPALGDPPAAHATRAADAAKDARGRSRGADRAWRAHVMRAVRLGTAGKVVALDRALKALALGLARDLDAVADLEGVHGHGLSDQELAGLVAELRQVTVGGGVRLAQVTELGLRERLLLAAPEGELHGLVAVALDGADRRDRTRTGFEDGHPLDASIVE